MKVENFWYLDVLIFVRVYFFCLFGMYFECFICIVLMKCMRIFWVNIMVDNILILFFVVELDDDDEDN